MANKPVLFHAIESVVGAGITDIGIVVGHTKNEVKAAVGDGSRWNAKVTYVEQPEPLGLAHAVLISEEFIGRERFVLFLGDNFLKGGIASFVQDFRDGKQNATIILTKVPNPREMGVAVVEGDRIVRLVEKPKDPPSDLGIVGIYLFDKHVFEAAKAIKPSWRNELEITDLNLLYLRQNQLHVKLLSRGMAWLDTGTTTTLLEASNYIATIEHRQGLKIACLEEVALRMGFITQNDLAKIIDKLPRNEYRDYLRLVCDEGPGVGPEPVG